MKITIIGIGLIGGSFALSIKKAFPDSKISGFDANPDHLEKALALKIIDKKTSVNQIEDSDVVIIAVPVDKANELLPEILDVVSDNTLVFDVGSTKKSICKAVKNHPKRRCFLATHPIAGTEFSGPDAALVNLFENKTNIICEVEKTAFKLQERALEIFKKIGLKIRYMDPASHDKHIAYVSHLSHISSFMLGKTVIQKEKNERDIFDMAGSGFASTVRLAKSSPTTWTSIFRENKENVLESLNEYIENLRGFKDFLEKEDFGKIFSEMENVNRIKQILNEIYN